MIVLLLFDFVYKRDISAIGVCFQLFFWIVLPEIRHISASGLFDLILYKVGHMLP